MNPHIKRIVTIVLAVVFLVLLAPPNVEAQRPGDCYVASSGCYSMGCDTSIFWADNPKPWAYIWFWCWDGKAYNLRGGTSGCCSFA